MVDLPAVDVPVVKTNDWGLVVSLEGFEPVQHVERPKRTDGRSSVIVHLFVICVWYALVEEVQARISLNF